MPDQNFSLPVEDILPDLFERLESHETVILTAPPGAGKSTIVPLRLLDQPWMKGRKIIMLEPRRIAARSVAVRMAQLIEEEIGQSVGYRIRFESKETDSTRLLVVTEGILIRMLQEDPALTGIGLVIFDEFHERSLQADVSLLLARESKKIFSSDVKLLIMSATIQSDRLSGFFDAPVVQSSGRLFEITNRYLGGDFNDPLPGRIVAAVHQAERETGGDILVFLPGTGEIMKVFSMLEEQSFPLLICPLYGELPFQSQQKAVQPDPQGRRKVILSTSVAETSLTIEGVTTVIDSGLSRVPRFDLQTGMNRLVTITVTRDSADQRAGRAGRLGPGVCYRLWDEKKTFHLNPSRKPELLEADLAPVILDLLNWGVDDLFNISWMDAPPQGHILQALDLLKSLEAVDHKNQLTEKGRKMAKMPLHPRLAHLLLEAGQIPGCITLGCDIAATLEERDPIGRNSGADLCLRLKELKAFRSREKTTGDRSVLERIDRLSFIWRSAVGQKSAGVQWPEHYEIFSGKLLAAAYPDRIARQLERFGNRYRLSTGKVVCLGKADPLIHASWLVVANGDSGAGEGKIFLAASIEENQLPGLPTEKNILRWDDKSEQVVQEREIWKSSLLISRSELKDYSGIDCSSIITEKIREKGLEWAGVSEDFLQLMARLNSLSVWNPASEWLTSSEQTLLDSLDDWLLPFLNSVRSRQSLQRLDWVMMIRTWIGYQKIQKLEMLAPDRISVPSGSQIKINYFPDGRNPELHVRLQEIFGWTTNPTVNQGKVPIVLHLLSPAFRPVQITTDLTSFWQKGYFEVRKELRSRYPKHSWPEDPLTAIAVRGVKRK